MKNKTALLLCICICMILLTACGINDISVSPMNMYHSDDELQTIYYDPKTGMEITKEAYDLYSLCDSGKELAPKLSIGSAAIGVIMLLFIRKSQKAKKIAILGFIIGIPVTIMMFCYYVFSFLIDYVLVPFG